MTSKGNGDIKVAVIGAGALGLVTLKNLLEEGFDATAYERKSYIGGLWKFTTDEATSALPTTVTNISKQRGCFTDFPFPDDTPNLCASADVDTYLQQYADHFELRPHVRLNTSIQSVKHDGTHWILDLGDKTTAVDKVIMATGANEKPSIPEIPNLDAFAGRVLHSQAFKTPSEFAGKNVLIVGFGSTAGDTAVSLLGHASSIYMAHRHGVYVLPRFHNGRSIDHGLTYKLMTVQSYFERWAPSISGKILNNVAAKMQDTAFPAIKAHPEWRIAPAPSLVQSFPTVSDDLVPALVRGDIQSVPGLKSVTGPKSVSLSRPDDGLGGPETLDDIDVIIFCTGYKNDLGMSLLDDSANPARNSNPELAALTSSTRGKPFPRLYRQLFSLDYPDSLAFMGSAAFPTPAFQLYDIASMAVAQVWGTGKSALPPQAEMEKAADAAQEHVLKYARRGPVYAGFTKQHEWLAWADEAAGTNVAANLGWTWAGWKLYLSDYSFYKMLTSGVYSPHLYRVFASDKRKAWPGAREAIERMNADLKEQDAKRKAI